MLQSRIFAIEWGHLSLTHLFSVISENIATSEEVKTRDWKTRDWKTRERIGYEKLIKPKQPTDFETANFFYRSTRRSRSNHGQSICVA